MELEVRSVRALWRGRLGRVKARLKTAVRRRAIRLKNRVVEKLRKGVPRAKYILARGRANGRRVMARADAPGAVFGIFDAVIVLSLPRSGARRRYVAEHLAAFGIRDFSFFDSTDADDPLVEAFYRSGRVKSYPPCFRCLRKDCGNPNCNNVLKPSQVATFLTYVRLWRAIAAGSQGRVLIVEDDVAFQPYASEVLKRLAAKIAGGGLPFQADVPILLRLGWAFGSEHADTGTLKLETGFRMSNPCHAMTRSFAAEISQRFHRIDTTCDEFLHAQNADVGMAYTVLPPLAAEMSWSNGAFPSEILPSVKHANHLRQAGDDAAAAQYEKNAIAPYIKRMEWRPLIAVGHPRCGSGFAADICTQMGVDVGHERVGAAGISSWMFAVDGRAPFAFDTLATDRRRLAWDDMLLHVRNLQDAIPSVMREHQHAPQPGYAYLRDNILRHTGTDLDAFGDAAERAAWSIILWCNIAVAQKPSLVFRIEDQAGVLAKFLRDRKLVPPSHRLAAPVARVINADKPYRGVRYDKPAVTPADIWRRASPQLRTAIRQYDDFFGYRNGWPES